MPTCAVLVSLISLLAAPAYAQATELGVPRSSVLEVSPVQVDPQRVGGGEWAELWLTSALFGAMTGGWVVFIDSPNDATAAAIVAPGIGAAIAMGATLTLELACVFDRVVWERGDRPLLQSGGPPAISTGFRLGLANGLLAMGIDIVGGATGGARITTWPWAASATGLTTGLIVALTARPDVDEVRFVESAALWGGALGTFAAMMTSYDDAMVGVALSLVGLDVGVLAALVTAGIGAAPVLHLTTRLDVGFVGGAGLGAFLVSLGYFAVAEDPSLVALGVAAAIGGVAGWLMFLLAGEDAPSVPSSVSPTIAPSAGGAIVGLVGRL